MEVKKFAMTLGAGMLTGAAVMLMMPKSSSVYKTADNVADAVKQGVCQAMDR